MIEQLGQSVKGLQYMREHTAIVGRGGEMITLLAEEWVKPREVNAASRVVFPR